MQSSNRIEYYLLNNIGDYLKTEVLTVDTTSKTLIAWYTKATAPTYVLEVVKGFPDLASIVLPTIALDTTGDGGTVSWFYGGKNEGLYPFFVHGFAGGETTDTKNKKQRETLKGDIRGLLNGAVIPLYDWSSGTKGAEIGSCDVARVQVRNLPTTGTTLAEQNRFLVSFAVRTFEQT